MKERESARRLTLPTSRSGTLRQGDYKGTSSELAVFLHGIGRAAKLVDPAVTAISNLPHKPDVWVPLLPYRSVLSSARAEDVLRDLCDDLDAIWDSGEYRSLSVVGHSMGGVYARALLLEGRKRWRAGSYEDQAEGRRHWSETTEDDRLVMLAAVNRGMEISRHMGPWRVIKTAAGLLLGKLMRVVGLEPLVFSVRRGAVFLTRLRLDWLLEESEMPLPLTVQLLGSIDDVVGPGDTIDMVTGARFRYLDVRNTGHLNILEMGGDGPDAEHRKKRLFSALLASVEDLEEIEVRPWELQPASLEEKERCKKVENLVFVIHGIRDVGHWTDKLARRVWQRAGEQGSTWEKVVDSYGYFGMGPFLLPGQRWKKVAWLMERYLEARAKYPRARFSYIGHSHGTWVLAKALEIYPSCRFHNVVFAGSIVRENYDWKRLISEEETGGQQVTRVLNLIATNDLVVALFPGFFNLYNLQDLGAAGHRGFFQASDEGPVYLLSYAKGGHGAGKQEALWDTIADFVLLGDDEDHSSSTDSRSPQATTLLKRVPSHIAQGEQGPARVLFWGSVLVWALIVGLVLVAIPSGILHGWPYLERAAERVATRVDGRIAAGVLAGLFLLWYLHLAMAQRKYRRAWDGLRSVLGLVILTAIAAASRWLALELGLELPALEEWRTAAILVWFAVIGWILLKI